MGNSTEIKNQLVKHLNGGEAFMPVEEMLKEVGFSKVGVRPGDLPYSFYELFYHCWFAQKDIFKYFRSPEYKAPDWPNDYWSAKQAPENELEWEELKSSYLEDRKAITEFILKPEIDLLQTVPSNEKHTYLRGILLVIEHTAYHTGQMLVILRHLGQHSS